MEQRNGNINKSDLEMKVTNVIHGIGIPANIKGYCYLRSAIMMAVERIEVLDHITKELYPDLAKKYKTTPSAIERGIRHSITVAWNRGPTETTMKIFVNKKKSKVTNSQFIATIADQIRIELMQDNN